MEEMKFCQSCGMPMNAPETKGTEEDGCLSEEYCTYCYQKGAFLQECTMEEMIEVCLQYGQDEDFCSDREEARKQMLEWFPTLKRWSAKA